MEFIYYSYEYVHVSVAEVKKIGLIPPQINLLTEGVMLLHCNLIYELMMSIVMKFKKADIAPNGFGMAWSKYQVVDLSVPIMIEPYRIVVPWPKEQSRLLAPIRPFQPLVSGHSLINLILYKIFVNMFISILS